jgi:WD40 repeat protein
MWPFSKPKAAPADKALYDHALNPFTEVQVLDAHKDIVHVLKTAASDMVLSGDDAGLIHVWNSREARLISRLQGHTRRVTACCVLNGTAS